MRSVDPTASQAALERLRWCATTSEARPRLLRLDDELDESLTALPDLLGDLPAAVWAAVLAEPDRYLLSAAGCIPALPAEAMQRRTMGASGAALLDEALAYLQVLRGAAGSLLGTGPVLELGAGWGLMARLLLPYLGAGQYQGFEHDPRQAALAQESGLGIQRSAVRPRPGRLPRRTTLAFAGQMFLQLSPEAFTHDLALLAGSLRPGGALVVGVRPPGFWLLPEHADPGLVVRTEAEGICHLPGTAAELGATAVSSAWMREQLDLVGLVGARMEWLPQQPHVLHWVAYRPLSRGAR